MNPAESRTAPGTSIIYLDSVTVDYDGFKALSRLNFYMDRKELRVVIGPNGAGKTTLLDVISGRVRPESGRVIFGHHTDLTQLRENEIAALGVGRKFQTPSVFVNLTVEENVELSLRRPSTGVLAALLERGDAADERRRIADTLERVGLTAKGGTLAGALSHGEKQWLEIAMVMAQDPELLLVDEPVAGMTDEETARTGELLMTIAADRSVLVIEHDMEFVRQIARKVTVLHQGTILCEGSVEQVQSDPRVLEVYLGQRREVSGEASGAHAVR
jgi:urea transport system ATP-binding protein